MHLVEPLQELGLQGLIPLDFGQMAPIEAMGSIILIGGNHFLKAKTLTDLLLGDKLMTLIFMMTVPME